MFPHLFCLLADQYTTFNEGEGRRAGEGWAESMLGGSTEDEQASTPNTPADEARAMKQRIKQLKTQIKELSRQRTVLASRLARTDQGGLDPEVYKQKDSQMTAEIDRLTNEKTRHVCNAVSPVSERASSKCWID